jgi:hypothetical protein
MVFVFFVLERLQTIRATRSGAPVTPQRLGSSPFDPSGFPSRHSPGSVPSPQSGEDLAESPPDGAAPVRRAVRLPSAALRATAPPPPAGRAQDPAKALERAGPTGSKELDDAVHGAAELERKLDAANAKYDKLAGDMVHVVARTDAEAKARKVAEMDCQVNPDFPD